jgi:rubrerythrin
MTQIKVDCQHACRNTCAMLNEALRKEASMVRFYEGILAECNYPEVRTFLTDLVEEKRKSILSIIQKLNELHVHSQSIDGIISSFNFNV